MAENKMQIKNRILLWLKPIQMWFQRRGRLETIIADECVNNIMKLVQPGDIILSYEAQRWTSAFIKGNYDHASIVTPDLQIMEAVGDKFYNGRNLGGVRKVSMIGFLYRKDHVAVIRPTLNDPGVNLKAAEKSLVYEGKGYDYSFSRNEETVYCSELEYLCYNAYDPTFLDIIPADKEILPIDYMKMCDIQPYRFKCLYDTRKING